MSCQAFCAMTDDLEHGLRLDKYYTSFALVEKCTNLWLHHIASDLTEEDLVIEPSAGNGAWIAALSSTRASLISIDIEPEAEGIMKANFYTWNPPHASGRIHVIGNPPFGKQCKEARRFILHAMSFCDVVAFILPRSFEKLAMQAVFRPFMLIHEERLPDSHGFIRNGQVHSVKTVFQIWSKPQLDAASIIRHPGKLRMKTSLRTHFSKHSTVQPMDFGFQKLPILGVTVLGIRRAGKLGGVWAVDAELMSSQLATNRNTMYWLSFGSSWKRWSVDELVARISLGIMHCRSAACTTTAAKSLSKIELVSIINLLYNFPRHPPAVVMDVMHVL